MTEITATRMSLEELITSMHEKGYAHHDLVQLLFGIIDEYCSLFTKRQGAGRPPSYPFSTILKVDMLMHLTGKRRPEGPEPKSYAKWTGTTAPTSTTYPGKRACGTGFAKLSAKSSTSGVRCATDWVST